MALFSYKEGRTRRKIIFCRNVLPLPWHGSCDENYSCCRSFCSCTSGLGCLRRASRRRGGRQRNLQRWVRLQRFLGEGGGGGKYKVSCWFCPRPVHAFVESIHLPSLFEVFGSKIYLFRLFWLIIARFVRAGVTQGLLAPLVSDHRFVLPVGGRMVVCIDATKTTTVTPATPRSNFV